MGKLEPVVKRGGNNVTFITTSKAERFAAVYLTLTREWQRSNCEKSRDNAAYLFEIAVKSDFKDDFLNLIQERK